MTAGFTDGDLRRRQVASQRGFYRALARGSPGSQLLEWEGGVQATIVPVRPWFSIFNSVFYESVTDLERLLPKLADAYESAGSKAWTVWVPPGDVVATQRLATAGHVKDSQPMLMAADIGEIDTERRLDLDLAPEASWTTVARCNDLAHGILEDWSMTAVVSDVEDHATYSYAARQDGEVVCALLAREAAGDCYLWFVATAPPARGQGLAAELVRVALIGAFERGCQTTTLESTAMAESLYRRLGYRSLGRYEMWERRD
jgi:ribosomal protein S18 acetylase RimI-like enzyme